MNAQPLAAEGRAERGQDQRQARRRVGRDQPVGEPVQPGELLAGGRDRLPTGDQRNHVIGVGIGRAHLAHDPALPQDDDAVGEAEHLVDVVAGQQDRGALLPQRHDQLFDLRCFLHAERGGRLVQGQQPGLAAHGPRHRHQLPLPTGQRADVARRVAERDAQRGQQFRGGHVETGVRQQQPAAFLAEHDVGGDVQVVAQGQVLPDHRDPLLDRRGLVGRHAPTREEHLAAGRDHFAGDAADQGGLARAVLASQRDELTGLHAEVDVLQGAEPAEADAQPGYGQQWSGRGGARRTGAGLDAARLVLRACFGRCHRTGHAVIVWPQPDTWPHRASTTSI